MRHLKKRIVGREEKKSSNDKEKNIKWIKVEKIKKLCIVQDDWNSVSDREILLFLQIIKLTYFL